MKVVICTCHGGFGLSREALHRLRELGNRAALEETDVGEKWPGSDKARDDEYNSFLRKIARNDEQLVQVVEEMGSAANGPSAILKIIDVPDGTDWQIEEYDGMERVAEKHQTWS
jgi:hypothetical protein